MSNKYKDDIIEHIESDIEKIQTKPNMYISYLGKRGALHLCKELINNAIDECTNPNSPGRNIDILLDETENTIYVGDDGRGIPFESMLIVCTTLQSGSKMFREVGGGSAGENGVGLTACAALSDLFEIISFRNGEKSKISLQQGKLTEPQKYSKVTKKDKHGTTFVLKPSPLYMTEDCEIDSEELMTWLTKIGYLIPNNIKIKLSIKKKGKESLVYKTYTNKNGMADYINTLCKKQLVTPIHVMETTNLVEEIHDKSFDRFLGLEFAFTYDTNNTEFLSDSFCNFINTIDNGVHVDAVKQAIMQFLVKKTKEGLSERDANKIDILFTDASNGLVLTVYIMTNYNIQFTGQTKEKISAMGIFKPIRDMTYKSLIEYFNNNPKELKKITDRIKANAKARIESTKIRNSVIKGETNNFNEFMMANFEPANNRGRNDYRELLIIEGKSAKGTASAGRFDRDTQAIFSIRGVPLNACGLKLDKVLLNDEFRTLIQILGTNVGQKFDISKMKYNKIILLADSDSDGYNITSLLCAFFMTHLPELVKKGYIYKAVSPLYKIKSKYKKFVLNKQEYVEVFEKNIRSNMRIYDSKTDTVYTDKQLQKLLLDNRNYLEELYRISTHLSIDATIVEFLAIHRNDKDFNKKFKKKFPELTIDEDKILSGIYDGKFQIVTMDKIFDKKIASIEYLVHEVNKDNMYFRVTEINNKEEIDKGVMTLGDFLALSQKYQPIIETRYKGVN